MDCTDVKTFLSGLVDDEIDAEVRHELERHLAGCAGCRQLLDEAEALDAMIRCEVDALAPGADRIAAMTAGVLSRSGPRPYLRQWTTWAGWLAAAAALALAITIWIADRRPAVPVATAPKGGPALPVGYASVYDTGNELQSLTLDFATATTPGGSATYLSSRDLETLAFAAWSLEAVETEDNAMALVDAREGVLYEGLLPRLADLRTRVDPADRGLLAMAESVLRRLAHDPLEPANIRTMREDAVSMDLHGALTDIIARHDRHGSL